MRPALGIQLRRTAYAPQVEGHLTSVQSDQVGNPAEASPQRLVETRPAAKGLQTHRHHQPPKCAERASVDRDDPQSTPISGRRWGSSLRPTFLLRLSRSTSYRSHKRRRPVIRNEITYGTEGDDGHGHLVRGAYSQTTRGRQAELSPRGIPLRASSSVTSACIWAAPPCSDNGLRDLVIPAAKRPWVAKPGYRLGDRKHPVDDF